MRRVGMMWGVVAALLATGPVWGEGGAMIGAGHEEMERALHDLAGQVRGLGAQFLGQFAVPERWPEAPLITIMLQHRQELRLSPQQVGALERLRADFQKEVIRRDADIRVAEMDLATLLRGVGSADLAPAEAKVREIERLRADLRIARLHAIEQGKALLTSEQRETLAGLVAETRPTSRGDYRGAARHRPLLGVERG
jgi:Spy/CpxP family protein refolding chaperone